MYVAENTVLSASQILTSSVMGYKGWGEAVSCNFLTYTHKLMHMQKNNLKCAYPVDLSASKTALQNALNIQLFSAQTSCFWNWEWKKPFLPMLFLRKFSDSCPPPLPQRHWFWLICKVCGEITAITGHAEITKSTDRDNWKPKQLQQLAWWQVL